MSKQGAGAGSSDQSSEPGLGVVLLALLIGCALLTFVTLGLDGELGSDDTPFVTAQQSGPVASNRPPPPGFVPPRGDTPGRRVGEGLALRPSSGSGSDFPGYLVTSDSDPAILAQTRLQVGDILTEIDGSPLDPERIKRLGDELSVVDRLEFTFERGGMSRNRTVDLTR